MYLLLHLKLPFQPGIYIHDVFQDDNELVLKRGAFYRASMQYVLLLQEVQERKKFEFVETVIYFRIFITWRLPTNWL